MELTYSDRRTLHSDDDWRIAIHESGHAIVAVRHDCIFEHVAIGPNEFGEVRWANSPLNDPGGGYTREKLWKWQTAFAAGAAAEHVVFSEIRRHAIRQDIDCHCQLGKMREDGLVVPFEFAIRQAVEMLSLAETENVARKLQEAKQLDFENICELIGVVPSWKQ